MPFGLHRGTAMANVPASYLLWLANNSDNLQENVKKYIEENKENLLIECGNFR
jgi:uncharacterized protein (DUF3820 family)